MTDATDRRVIPVRVRARNGDYPAKRLYPSLAAFRACNGHPRARCKWLKSLHRRDRALHDKWLMFQGPSRARGRRAPNDARRCPRRWAGGQTLERRQMLERWKGGSAKRRSSCHMRARCRCRNHFASAPVTDLSTALRFSGRSCS